MYEVIEKFIKFQLKRNSSFVNIKNLVENHWKVGSKFIGTTRTGVKLSSNQNANPHSFDFEGTIYYVTKELGDKKETDNFYKFRINVNKNFPNSFKIVQI